MKKTMMYLTLLVLTIMLLTTGSAVTEATEKKWSLTDYLTWTDGGVSESFDSGFDQEISLEVDGIRFAVRDAYVSADSLILLTEISRADGQPTLFSPSRAIANPDTRLACTLVKELVGVDETTTVSKYAAAKDMPIRYVSVSVSQQDTLGNGTMDFWLENDHRTVCYTNAQSITPINGEVVVEWEVSVINFRTEDRDDLGEWNTKTLTFTLPVKETNEEWYHLNQRIDVKGVPLMLDHIILKKSELETHVDIFYHVDSVLPEDQEIINRYRFELVDGETLELLPSVTGRYQPRMTVDAERSRTSWMHDKTISPDAMNDSLHLQLLTNTALTGEDLPTHGDADAPVITIPLR